MNKLKIKSIKKLDSKRKVYDISVQGNHNFFITKNQILTHNCDFLSHASQSILRGLMETYSDTSRFILTCNYPNKILAPLHSRCQSIQINKTDLTEFTARIAKILLDENVEFDLDLLDTFVHATYPDLRKCINLCQQSVKENRLESLSTADSGMKDYRLEMVELIKARKFREARTIMAGQIRNEDVDELFRWMYDNLDLWSSTPNGQDQAILIIKQGIINNNFIADAEINVSSVLIELSYIDSDR
jgi:DNA polymerase III delta prime subunit